MWKVLLADDEPFVREGVEKLVPWDELGYELEGTYKNGKELLEAVPVKMPDLVIMDIQMPFVTGLEAAKLIHEEYPEISVILLTAYAEFRYAQQAIEYGVDGYILKSNLLIDLPKFLEGMAKKLEKKKEIWDVMKSLAKTEETAMKCDVEEESDLAEYEEAESGDELIQLTNAYVKENLANKITLDDIADAVHVNRSYLSRLYKQKTGENLFEMINRSRIDMAKDFIRQRDKKIYEIAYLVGLDDTAYFSRLFKKYAGCSPKDYVNSLNMKKEESAQ